MSFRFYREKTSKQRKTLWCWIQTAWQFHIKTNSSQTQIIRLLWLDVSNWNVTILRCDVTSCIGASLKLRVSTIFPMCSQDLPDNNNLQCTLHLQKYIAWQHPLRVLLVQILNQKHSRKITVYFLKRSYKSLPAALPSEFKRRRVQQAAGGHRAFHQPKNMADIKAFYVP